MNYEEKINLENKKKKKRQTIFLILSLIVLGGVLVMGINIQKQSDKKAFSKMVFKTYKNVKDNYNNDKLLEQELDDKIYTFPDKTIINFDERTLTGGTIIRYGNGEIEFAVYNKKWCAKKERNGRKIIVTEYETGKCNIEK